jgi:hypothetical protein
MTPKTYVDVIFSGGYHESGEILLRVDPRFVETKCMSYLTEHHKRRLRAHFCGIKGCACGAYQRAEWRVAK